MDFAFAYILIAFVTLAVKVAFVLATGLSILVMLWLVREVWQLHKQLQRRNELH
jgi:hypothetical protein